MKKYIGLIAVYIIITILGVTWAGNQYEKNGQDVFDANAINVKGVVESVTETYSEIDGQKFLYQEIQASVKAGPDKGSIVEVNNTIIDDTGIIVKEGDKVMLYGASDPALSDGYTYYIMDYYHLDALIWIGLIFVALVCALGGKAGLKAVGSLGISLVMIFGILIPLAKIGYNPVMLAVIIGITTALFAITIIQGMNVSSLTAFAGTAGGLVIASIIAGITIHLAGLTGLSTEDSRLLSIYYPTLNFQGLFLAGIMIGALGAIMDVAVSISAGLIEIKKHKPRIKAGELIISGLNIGKDIMGSMMNTLIFAYVGTSLMIIMLFHGSGTSVVEILNYGFISEEIARSLVGSFGLLATIPLTAIIGGLILSKAKISSS